MTEEGSKLGERPSEPVNRPRKPYSAPELAIFGDVRDVTMGVSPGVGESGNPVIFRI